MPKQSTNFIKDNIAVIIIVVVLIAAAAGAVYYVRNLMGDDSGAGKTTNQDRGEENVNDNDGAAAPGTAGATAEKSGQTYAHPELYFSFNYPEGFTVGNMPDGSGGEVILVNDPKKQIGLQILITKYDGAEIDLTPELIRASIADMEINNPREITVDGNRGVAFMSNNEAFNGKSSEIWFIYDGNLYQLTTYAEQDELLQGVFKTLKFE